MKVLVRKSEAESPFTFVFTNKDGDALVRSENYKQKTSCMNGIESVRKNCLEDSRYEFKTAKNGKFFFNIKASNGQVVGTSSFFDSEDERKNAIIYLKRYAPKAATEEA
jgi:hypothetical protein